VVEYRKLLRFRQREDRRKALHCQRDRFAIAFPAIHEQDAGTDFAIVFVTAVEPGNFLPFPQILIEEIEHLTVLAGAADKHKQEQLHQPARGFLDPRRRVGERELDQGIDVPLVGDLLRIPGHPRRWHRPINGHARFVDGDFAKGFVVASHF
jgi:hypothetical protein